MKQTRGLRSCLTSTDSSAVSSPPKSTQPGHPSVGKHSEYRRRLGRIQTHLAMWCTSRVPVCGLAVQTGVWLRLMKQRWAPCARGRTSRFLHSSICSNASPVFQAFILSCWH